MTKVEIPSDDALMQYRAEIIAQELDQEKVAWQAKVSELEANSVIIERQIAALREQADQGNYDTNTSPSHLENLYRMLNPPEVAKRQREQDRQQKLGKIMKIRRDLGALGLRDNEPVVHRYLTPRRQPGEDGPHPAQTHVNGILCTQGDTIMYAEQWLGFLGEFESDTPDYEFVLGARTNEQYLLCPSIAPDAPNFDQVVALFRSGAYPTDADLSHYRLEGSDTSALSEIEGAVYRYRVNCLIEGVEALLSETGEYCKLKHGDPYPSGRSSWREQTYTLGSEATVAVSARYETYLQQDPKYKEPEPEFPKPYDGEGIDAYYDRAGIHEYHRLALEAFRASYNIPHKHLEEVTVRLIDATGADRYIILNKVYLDIEKGTLGLKEAEDLIAKITVEWV